ncbi:MAG: viroplasmin family protein [bacterium]
MKKDEIIIYTDGSSLGNPGPGGWGSVVLFPENKVVELGGREKESTNNRMEMMASIMALKEVEKRKIKAKTIKIHTDSSYLLNGITMWVHAWVKNNWKTKTGEDVLNKDLWEMLYKVNSNLSHKYEIEWVKVSGHSGVHLNERCDVIATSFSANNTTILFTGSFEDYEKLFGQIDFEETAVRAGKKTSKNKNTKTAYSYVSAVGVKVHADKTWAECEKRVKGKSGAKYKKVFSKEEEQELVAEWTLKSLF